MSRTWRVQLRNIWEKNLSLSLKIKISLPPFPINQRKNSSCWISMKLLFIQFSMSIPQLKSNLSLTTTNSDLTFDHIVSNFWKICPNIIKFMPSQHPQKTMLNQLLNTWTRRIKQFKASFTERIVLRPLMVSKSRI